MAYEREQVWAPKTRLGKMVSSGQIKTIEEAFDTGLPIKEPEIIDALIPDLVDEVLDISMVQRMTDSGAGSSSGPPWWSGTATATSGSPRARTCRSAPPSARPSRWRR